MKYLEIVHKDFMGEQTHKVSDISTARHYLNAWYMASKQASDYMNVSYKPIKQHVLHKSTLHDDVKEWRGFDGKNFEETMDDLDFMFLLFRHECANIVTQTLKPYGLEPELKESYLATIAQPEGLLGLMIGFDRNAREKISLQLQAMAEFRHATDGSCVTKNRTGHDIESCMRVIEGNCAKVRWPSNITIYNRNLIKFAKVDA